jgi:outer membrane receptor for ferrienterochelin and colicins
VSARRALGRHLLVGGAAIEHDGFDPLNLPQFSYSFTTPGMFIQDDVTLASWLTMSASGRYDHHNEYGSFVSPRLAALFRGSTWSARVSAGTGFSPATPLTEETEAAGLTGLTIRQPLRAEQARSGSIDVTRTVGSLSITATAFASRVRHPLWVNRESAYTLENLVEPTTNTGSEVLATWRRPSLSVTGSYVYVRSRELDGVAFADVPLTPRHSFGLVGMWEREGAGRVGLEFYYTGQQRLEANPYRGTSEPYVVMGVLLERPIGPVRIFVNGENLTNVRQTKFDPLIRPTPGADGRWSVDSWSPLDGRNVNGGIRLRF